MKKSKQKSKTKAKSSKEQEYLAGLDLRDWWEEFATSTSKNGTLKYPTVWSFIVKKTKQKWQKDFLYWILGPKVEDKGKALPYDFEQFDWESRRQNGFWFSSKNAEGIRQEVKSRHTAFDKLAVAGQNLLDDLSHVAVLTKQLQQEYGGRLFLPELSARENQERVKFYVDLNSQIVMLKEKILNIYSKTLGMDMQRLDVFLQMMAQGAGLKVAESLGFGSDNGKAMLSGSTEETKYKTVMNSITEMMMKKSAELEIPLPDDVNKVVQAEILPPKRKVM